MVTGAEGSSVVAHHVRCLGGGGTGLKPSDFLCVPLTSEEHERLHRGGEKSYWADRGHDPRQLITMHLLVYFAAKHPDNYAPLADLLSSLEG